MAYYFQATLPLSFADAVEAVTQALKERGFGILTSIDVKQTLRRQVGGGFPSVHDFGACNPQMAFKALQKEPRIGTMLPCNIIVREIKPGEVEVAAVDPVASMQAIENKELGVIAAEVRTMLQEVVNSLRR